MIKQFFKDNLVYTVSGIITGGITFILLPFFTAIFTVEEFGIYEYLVIFGNLIGVTVALEISQGVARFIPENLDVSIKKRLYASTSLWFTVFCFLLFILFIIFFKESISVVFFDTKSYSKHLLIATLSYFLFALVTLISNQLKWELKSLLSSVISIIYSLVSIISSIIYVYIMKLGVIGAFWGNITGGVIAIIAGLYYTRQSYAFLFNFDMLKEMLSFSFPLVFSSSAYFLANYIDRVVIKELMSLTELGIYGVAFRISGISMLAIYGFQGALIPLLYRHYQEEATAQKMVTIFRYFTLYVILIFASLSLFGKELILIFANSQYLYAVNIIPFLVISILLSRMYIFFPGMGLKKKTIYIALINILTAAINLGLNYLFIPYIGLIGAAVATCLSAIIYITLCRYISQKYYYIPYKLSKPIILFFFVVLLTFLFNFININTNYVLILMIKIFLLIFIFISLWLLEVIKTDEINYLILLLKNKLKRMFSSLSE